MVIRKSELGSRRAAGRLGSGPAQLCYSVIGEFWFVLTYQALPVACLLCCLVSVSRRGFAGPAVQLPLKCRMREEGNELS